MEQPPKASFLLPNISQQVLNPPVSPAGVQVTEIHSGPIPSPEVIAGYEKVLAGSADRIIKMAEKEQEHRHKIQTRNQTQQAALTLAGQVFAFALGISGVLGGIYLVKDDKSISGFGVFFTSLATLVGLFFFNQSRAKTRKPEAS